MRTSELALIIARLESLCQGSTVYITQRLGAIEITWRSRYAGIIRTIPNDFRVQFDDIDKIYLNTTDIKLQWEKLTAEGIKKRGMKES